MSRTRLKAAVCERSSLKACCAGRTPFQPPSALACSIPLAEKAGFIESVTTWVADRLMTKTGDLPRLQVAFNASTVEFAALAFVEQLGAPIERRTFDPSRLEVEITETALLQSGEDVRANTKRLPALVPGAPLLYAKR